MRPLQMEQTRESLTPFNIFRTDIVYSFHDNVFVNGY